MARRHADVGRDAKGAAALPDESREKDAIMPLQISGNQLQTRHHLSAVGSASCGACHRASWLVDSTPAAKIACCPCRIARCSPPIATVVASSTIYRRPACSFQNGHALRQRHFALQDGSCKHADGVRRAPSKDSRVATARRGGRPCCAVGIIPHASEKMVSVPSAAG